LFQSLGPVYCIDLRVKDFFDEVVVRLLLVAILDQNCLPQGCMGG